MSLFNSISFCFLVGKFFVLLCIFNIYVEPNGSHSSTDLEFRYFKNDPFSLIEANIDQSIAAVDINGRCTSRGNESKKVYFPLWPSVSLLTLSVSVYVPHLHQRCTVLPPSHHSTPPTP